MTHFSENFIVEHRTGALVTHAANHIMRRPQMWTCFLFNADAHRALVGCCIASAFLIRSKVFRFLVAGPQKRESRT